MHRTAIVGLVVTMGLLGGSAPAGTGGPGPGDRAPAFALPASTGGTVGLTDFAGRRHVILAFYIQDFTPG